MGKKYNSPSYFFIRFNKYNILEYNTIKYEHGWIWEF